MARAWNGAWLTLAFLSESAALAALAYGGWQVPGPVGLRLLVAVAAPAGAAVLWGMFAAPRARVPSAALAVGVKVLVFGSAVLALAATGHPRLAVTLALAAALSATLSTPPVGRPPGRPAAGGPTRTPHAPPAGGSPSG